MTPTTAIRTALQTAEGEELKMDAYEFLSRGDHRTLIDVLTRARCSDCQGMGEQDDAEPGDTSFRIWPCGTCDGKGWNKQALREIVAVA